MKHFERRKFLRSLATVSAVTGLGNFSLVDARPINNIVNTAGNRFKISLNAYSFNGPLRSGKTNLDAVLRNVALRPKAADHVISHSPEGVAIYDNSRLLVPRNRIAINERAHRRR